MAEDTGPLSNEYDWYLDLFIALAEKGATLPITLNVGGMLITGLLISTTEYLDGVAKLVSEHFAKKGTDPEEVKSIEESLSLRRFLTEKMAVDTTIPPTDMDETDKYIHLKNVRFYLPSNNQPTYPPGLLWRGKASAVAGFIFGELIAKLA